MKDRREGLFPGFESSRGIGIVSLPLEDFPWITSGGGGIEVPGTLVTTKKGIQFVLASTVKLSGLETPLLRPRDSDKLNHSLYVAILDILEGKNVPRVKYADSICYAKEGQLRAYFVQTSVLTQEGHNRGFATVAIGTKNIERDVLHLFTGRRGLRGF